MTVLGLACMTGKRPGSQQREWTDITSYVPIGKAWRRQYGCPQARRHGSLQQYCIKLSVFKDQEVVHVTSRLRALGSPEPTVPTARACGHVSGHAVVDCSLRNDPDGKRVRSRKVAVDFEFAGERESLSDKVESSHPRLSEWLGHAEKGYGGSLDGQS